MNKSISFFRYFFLIFISFNVFSQENLNFNQILHERGLAHSDVTSIIQDNQDFIWFGTLGGLNRFDGYDLKTYSNQNSPFESVYKNRIQKIIQSKKLLWLVTEGGVECFNKIKEKYLNLEWRFNDNSSLENTKLSSVYISKNNILYVLSDKYFKAFQIQKKEDGSLVLNEMFLKDVQENTNYVDMQEDSNGLLWVVSNKGLFNVNENKGNIDIKKIIVQGIVKNYQQFTGISTQETNYLLLGTQNGFIKANTSVFKKEQKSVSATYYQINFPVLSANIIPDAPFFVSSFQKGINKNYWIGSTYGLIKAELSGNDYDFSFYKENNSNLSTSSVVGLLKDNANCLWVSNYEGGVYYIDLSKKGFKSIVHDSYSENSISENYVRAIVEDKKGNIWIGTEKTGLNYYDFKSQEITKFKQSNNSKSLSSNKVRSLLIDHKNRLWVGTFEGINIYSKESSSFFKISSDKSGDKGLSQKIIFSMAEDKFGNIWAGSWVNGLNRINYKNPNDYKVEKIYKKEGNTYGLSSNVITFIYADDFYPEVLVGTNNGLNHIFLKEDGSVKEILHYKGNQSYNQSISSNWVWPIVRQNDSVFWVGTLGGGLNKLTLNSKLENGYKAKHYGVKEGASSSDIETILYDSNKNELWLGGKGISRFNIEKETFINYDKADGLVGNSFKIGASFKGDSGRFYFGSTEGVSYFYPDEIQTNSFDANVVLTNLFVNNEVVEIGDPDSDHQFFKQTFNTLDEIELNHLQNNFQIQFSSLHYANPKRTQFKYRLIEYDKDWIYTNSTDRKANYSNLPYGDYLFEVRATNNDGVWSKNSKQLKIKILAPWWFTNLALVCYAVLIILILLLSYYLIIRWFGLKKAYEVSVIQDQEKEKLYQLTGQFFTNISHEFKTPLTLILNPLEKLLNESDINKFKKEKYYQLMYKNAKRLLRLINELVDYRKVNSTAFKLNAKPYHLNPFFEDIRESFKSALEKKEINYTYVNNLESDKLQFDRTVLEKIIFNILGNAIKFSPENSKITIKLNSKDEENHYEKYSNVKHIKNEFVASSYIYMSIEDEGRGIDEISIMHIFDRFFQGENNADIQGSGIGLTLVKSLVDIHKMNLSVYSEEGVGTKFVVEIPDIDYREIFGYANNHSSVKLSKSALSPLIPNDDVEINSKVELFENFTKPKVLLVEDNVELRGFIKDDFDADYHIIEASNGAEALELLDQHQIQVIISDIMMPIMDGVSFCAEVKQSEKYRNIPFILLSAKYNVQSQIEGAQSGADIYLSKPFSLEVLNLTVLNVLKSRKLIKESSLEKTFEEARKNVQGNLEDEFLKQVINCIDDNIDNVNFDVVMLCKLLGVSKTKLYAKVKAVTSESVGSLIRGIRLKKAAQILSSTDLNVIQVMDKVGIQSQSHFTKSFKKQFGVTPSEFVKNLKTKSS